VVLKMSKAKRFWINIAIGLAVAIPLRLFLTAYYPTVDNALILIAGCVTIYYAGRYLYEHTE
jgi:hypothetical protein